MSILAYVLCNDVRLIWLQFVSWDNTDSIVVGNVNASYTNVS